MKGNFFLLPPFLMSHILWKYYLEDNVEKFEAFLAGGHNALQAPKGQSGGNVNLGSVGAFVGSPGNGSSPRTTSMKLRKTSGHMGAAKNSSSTLSKSDLNSRDQMGLTILHRVVSSAAENSIRYATALINHPSIDIYMQDIENGWTPLHRALYAGNVTIARLLLAKDQTGFAGQGGLTVSRSNTLIKIKDREGNTAFDVYNATIARRTLDHGKLGDSPDEELDEDGDDSVHAEENGVEDSDITFMDGDELFAFGSNKNLCLGFGDEDDRQYPERITLKRPDHLILRFCREHFDSELNRNVLFSDFDKVDNSTWVSDLPVLVRNRPIVIQDVVLSKLHSAVITTDPESNLHICGFGPGGRLGTGDETTRFNYVCIDAGALAGKKIVSVALGQNHTLAVSKEGEIFTWGTNTYGQLGYNLPRPAIKDEEPINSTPRQIFGPLKREVVVGVAASAVHSVAYTATSIFTWGKNHGQLGLMDSDSRSLDIQPVPRR